MNRARLTVLAATVLAAVLLVSTTPVGAGAQGAGEPLITVGVEVTGGTVDRADYSITVYNRGTATAEDATVTANVPANTTFSASDPAPGLATTPTCVSGAAAGTACSWQLPDIAPGGSETVNAGYGLIRPATGGYTLSVSLAASASASDAPSDSDTDSSLEMRGSNAAGGEDTYVDDREPAGTNHGACDTLRVEAGNEVTSYVDDDGFAVPRVSPSLPEGNSDGAERILDAELRAVVTTTSASPAAPASVGAHRISSGEWAEGAGTCDGAAGTGRAARTGAAPSSEPAPVATSSVGAPGLVSWDVTEAVDTDDERARFTGFELRDAGSAAETTTAFGSMEAAADRQPRFDVVYVKLERTRCIEAEPEQGAAPSTQTQSVDALVTDGSHKVTGTGSVACSGAPVEGERVEWELEDDDPDAYVASVNGNAVPRELGGDDAGPDHAVVRTDSEGHASMTLALGHPGTAGSNAGENRIAARANNGDAAEPGSSPFCTPDTCTGESIVEDDVTRSWDPVAGEDPGTEGPDGTPRVYMVTVDGLNRDEVGAHTPNLAELRDQGTWWEEARAVFPAETLPNHVSMATGALPRDHGIVANKWWKPNWHGSQRDDMQQPALLDRDTIVTRLEESCDASGGIRTATVMSKTYLLSIFRGEPADPDDPHRQRQADYHPSFPLYIPFSDHIVDSVTMQAFRDWVAQQPDDVPQFGWLNLGDVDRGGHIDEVAALTNGGMTSIREGALVEADAQIGMLVEDLKQSGAWDETVLIINSDHRMDWGTQDKSVTLSTALTAAGYEMGKDFQTVGGGGTGLVYVLHEENIAPMARIVNEIEGVEFVSTPESIPDLDNPTSAEMGIDNPRSPQIQAFLEPGWHNLEGDTNHIPGNHGHPITQPSVLMVAGGHPMLDDEAESISGEPVYDPDTRPFAPPAGGPGNLSAAPTIASVFGIGEPREGYELDPLSEAFDPGALAPHVPCSTDPNPSRDPGGGPPSGGGNPPGGPPAGGPLGQQGKPKPKKSCKRRGKGKRRCAKKKR
jgi:uncharacterized repeat protein (TIGR01451 family)